MGKLKQKKIKIDIYKILLAVFTIILCCVGFYATNQANLIDQHKEILTKIDMISSDVQRVAKLELEGNYADDLIAELNLQIDEITPVDGISAYLGSDLEMIDLLQIYIADYYIFIDTAMKFRINAGRDSLFSASEHFYEISAVLVNDINTYIDGRADYYNQVKIALGVVIGIVVLFILKIVYDTLEELKKNKELSKEMFIDTSTGLYNRAKCQEILKTQVNMQDKKDRAIIIFDLNDLKKTNDQLGHRAGDDLIASFGATLKEATNVSADEIFVGRYGGDEFMAFLESCVEADVTRYIEEVEYLMDQFNIAGTKQFKLSCAAGYSITTEATKSTSMRDLFDVADANMYENKLAMKAKKKREMEAQGIVVEEHVDDRL